MILSFFEEFPTESNLQKLSLLRRPAKLYLAASSFSQFLHLSQKLKNNTKVREVIYWPIFKRKEGYWISPFAKKSALQRIFKELEGKYLPVLLDLELPTTQNKVLYLTQALSYRFNKKLIESFIVAYPGKIYAAEYYPDSKIAEFLFQKIGLHYSSPKIHIIKMFYHSLHPFSLPSLEKKLRHGKQQWGTRFIPAFGVLGSGIHSNEPRITLFELARELRLAKKLRIQEVILYRLGGLEKSSLKTA